MAMKKEELETWFKALVAEQLGIDASKVVGSKEFIGDLGADSLDLAQLRLDLQDKFDIIIHEEYAETIETVQEALDALFTKLNK